MGSVSSVLGDTRVPKATSSALVSVAAQGLSSASNLFVQAGLALTLAPGAFGSLVVGFSVYYFALALVRAFVGDPLVALSEPGEEDISRCEVIRESDDADVGPVGLDAIWSRLRARLAAISLAAVILIGVVAIAAGSVRVELAVLAAAVPVLLAQDAYRYLAWARHRATIVLALDGVWLISSVALVGGCAVGLGSSIVTGRLILAAWCGGGVLSAVLARRLRPASVSGRPWWRWRPADQSDDLDLAQSLSWTQAVLAVDANGLPVVVAGVAGATLSGGLRTATLPFMPVTTAVAALRVLALPRLGAAVASGRGRPVVTRIALGFGAIGLGASGAMLGLLALAPDRWLGPSGRMVEPWFALGAVVVVARVVNLPLSDVLALGAGTRRAIVCRLSVSGLAWTATVGGAVLSGLQGALAARAGASVVAIGIWGVAVANATGSSPKVEANPQG